MVELTRRHALAAVAAAALAGGAPARTGPARIGILDAATPAAEMKWRQVLLARLQALGYSTGLAIEARHADNQYDRLPQLAAELVQAKVDVILAVATPAIRAAQRATQTIPIVMVRTADPVGMGFVESLARPGRNVTGLTNINVDVSSKYLEFLRAVSPRAARVGVLANPGTQTHAGYLRNMQAAAGGMAMQVVPAEARDAAELASAFASFRQDRVEALAVLPDPYFYAQAAQIAALAVQARLPNIAGTRDAAEAGALMSYGQDIGEHYVRAASYIDRILKGAAPADLPVERPTKLELVMNQRTARALGISFPRSLLLRADFVVE